MFGGERTFNKTDRIKHGPFGFRVPGCSSLELKGGTKGRGPWLMPWEPKKEEGGLVGGGLTDTQAKRHKPERRFWHGLSRDAASIKTEPHTAANEIC